MHVPAISLVLLTVLPLWGYSAPFGYIYNASPDPAGGLLAAALAFFSHQGHQVIHNLCLDLNVYRSALGRGAIIIPIDNLANHILMSRLDLLDGIFTPSRVDVPWTSFMVAYLICSPAPDVLDPAAVLSSLGLVGGP
jgi:hypothetical protein